jgi:HEAT repeat protein
MSVRVTESDPARTIEVTESRRQPGWTKFFSLAVIANAAAIAIAVWVARLIRAIPATDEAEQWLRVVYYGGIALAAIFDALLLDEALFKGAFRKTHILGRLPGFAKRDEDVDDVAISMQRSTWSFPLLLLTAGMVTSMLLNLVTRDLDGYYRSLGVHIGALHRGDAPRQIAAIKELSIRRAPEVLPNLKRALAQGGEAAPWAAWALGRHRDLPSRRPLIAPLVSAVREGSPALRREAAIALGRLQQRSMVGALQQELRADLDAGNAIDVRLLYALGSVQVTSSKDLLHEVLQQGDAPAQRIAAWAIAQHRDQRGAKDFAKLLEDRLPTADVELRCAIVHSLGIFAHERSNLALVRAYDSSTEAELAFGCPRIRIPMSPDGTDDFEEILMPEDTLALKILASMGQMRATTPEVRAVVEPWLERRVADTTATLFIQEGARTLLAGIREARNDATKPTVDEVFDD